MSRPEKAAGGRYFFSRLVMRNSFISPGTMRYWTSSMIVRIRRRPRPPLRRCLTRLFHRLRLDQGGVEIAAIVDDVEMDSALLDGGANGDLTGVVRAVGVLDDIGAGFVDGEREPGDLVFVEADLGADGGDEVADEGQVLRGGRHVKGESAFERGHGDLLHAAAPKRPIAAGRSASMLNRSGNPSTSKTW